MYKSKIEFFALKYGMHKINIVISSDIKLNIKIHNTNFLILFNINYYTNII